MDDLTLSHSIYISYVGRLELWVKIYKQTPIILYKGGKKVNKLFSSSQGVCILLSLYIYIFFMFRFLSVLTGAETRDSTTVRLLLLFLFIFYYLILILYIVK